MCVCVRVSVCLCVGVGCPIAQGARSQASRQCVHGSANNVCQVGRVLPGEPHRWREGQCQGAPPGHAKVGVECVGLWES